MSVSLKEVNDKISKAQVEQMHSYFSALEDFKNGKLKALNHDVLELREVDNSEIAVMSLRHLQSYELSLSPKGNLNLYIRLSGYTTSPTNNQYPNREVFNIDIYNFDLTGKLTEYEDLVLLVRNNALEVGCNAEERSLLAEHFKLGNTMEKMQTGSKSVVKELNEGILVPNNPANVAGAAAAKSATLTLMAAMQSKHQLPLNQLVGGAAPAAAQDDAATAMLVLAKATR